MVKKDIKEAIVHLKSNIPHGQYASKGKLLIYLPYRKELSNNQRGLNNLYIDVSIY